MRGNIGGRARAHCKRLHHARGTIAATPATQRLSDRTYLQGLSHVGVGLHGHHGVGLPRLPPPVPQRPASNVQHPSPQVLQQLVPHAPRRLRKLWRSKKRERESGQRGRRVVAASCGSAPKQRAHPPIVGEREQSSARVGSTSPHKCLVVPPPPSPQPTFPQLSHDSHPVPLPTLS